MSAISVLPENETIDRRGLAETPSPEPVRPPDAPKRILVVDDALVRASVAAVLDCEGYEIYGAADGESAIKSAIKHQPDLSPVLLRAIRKLTHESGERRNLRITHPAFVTRLLDNHTSNDF